MAKKRTKSKPASRKKGFSFKLSKQNKIILGHDLFTSKTVLSG